MKRKKSILLILLFSFFINLVLPTETMAASSCKGNFGIDFVGQTLESEYDQNSLSALTGLSFKLGGLAFNTSYQLLVNPNGIGQGEKVIGSPQNTGSNDILSFLITDPNAITEQGGKGKKLLLKWDIQGNTYKCEFWNYKILVTGSCNITYNQEGFTNTQCLDRTNPFTINITDITYNGNPYSGNLGIIGLGSATAYLGSAQKEVSSFSVLLLSGASHQTAVFINKSGTIMDICQQPYPPIQITCTPKQRVTPINPATSTTSPPEPFQVCNQVADNVARGNCEECFNKNGLWTSIGCIETTAKGVVGKLMKVGLGIAGGIALLMILSASFILTTSQGDTKRTNEAKEMLTSALIGLLFIIFSVTILQFIGVSLFKIPEFGM